MVSKRASAVALVTWLLVAACSSSALTASPSAATATPATAMATATATATPSEAPSKGAATQQMTLAGPSGSAIAVTNAGIRCSLPASDATLQISVLAQPSDPNLSVYIFVQPGNVTVRYDSGSGATYVERDFAGTGVTGFDAAKGAQIDTQLTEVATNQAHGSLGVLTSLKGNIDCGNQLPGSSTLTFSGPTPKGALSGGLNPVSVSCTTSAATGSSVSVIGLVQVGSTPTYMIMSISPSTFTVYPVGAGFYRSTSTAVATLTATGAHLDGDALEQNLAAGATAHTIHVTGDVVCGTTITG
jgi:hypothetical protein